jgi:putative intracellular protease/amidase
VGQAGTVGQASTVGTPDATALTMARTRGSLLCAGGLVCTPQLMFAAAPKLAGVLIPGGLGAQKAGRDPALRTLMAQAQADGLPVGVCGSGLLLAGEAGLLRDRVVGCPAPLADTVWGYLPADLQADQMVHDCPAGAGALYSGSGGLNAVRVVLALAEQLWGAEQAKLAAERVGMGGQQAIFPPGF